ncbi:phenylalanine N-monooxygenase-like [Hibiscus syriacus]|uniref:Phenylalanine N-monooxygenase-like n=1 Tax=Hibiscus syriacus TaxID=106335 RepID=A0A6A3CS56_HIBSY|nr:phenylalanine N-monooxygenase-like [Hibiscus syriacus]
MTSCYRRITIGPTAMNIPVQPLKSRHPVEIPLFPRCSYNNIQFSFGISLRPRNFRRVQAVRPEGRSEGGDNAEKVRPGPGRCFYSVEDRTVEVEKGEKNRTVEVVLAAAMTVVFGVGNRVLYKLALVPLKRYPFFLAQLATFGYVVVYFSVMHLRYHAGIVTDEMLSMPKAPFLGVGLLEALATVTGMAAGAILSGASITIFSQEKDSWSEGRFYIYALMTEDDMTFLVWQILLSIIFLGRRYRVNHLLGCFLVAVGVIITVASGSSTGHSLKEAGIFWSLMMIISFLLQAAGTVLKALFIGILLPFFPKLCGIPFSQLANYLKDGAACFLNIAGTLSSGCDGAPLLPLLFVIVNIGFNISLLHLLKISSAVVSSLASTFSVPIAVYIFTLPLPYLGVASPLPTGFVAGAIILVIGLLIYAWSPSSSSSALPSPPPN